MSSFPLNIALLGFGKVGQVIFEKVQNDPDWQERFVVSHIWNRSPEVFEGFEFSEETRICASIPEMLEEVNEIDLVVECSHPSVLHEFGVDILEYTDLFISSPTAFSKPEFHQEVVSMLEKSGNKCYLPVGASVGLWDVIRLDQNRQLKGLQVEMKKHPHSFRISEPEAKAKLEEAERSGQATKVISGPVGMINPIAPQNTNTMSVYALAAQSLGFAGCHGSVVADASLDAHIVTCKVETTLGLTLDFERYNPAKKDAVTGSATFSSFLNSLIHFQQGVTHNQFVFC